MSTCILERKAYGHDICKFAVMASGSNVDFRTLLDRYHGMDLNAVCDEMTTDNTVQHSRDAPKPPTDEEKAAIKRLKICYNTLQLEPSEHRQLALLRLLRAWLLRHCRTHRLPLFSGNIYMDTLLDDTSLAFLMVFGQRLWPIANTDNINRKHLVPAATHVFERGRKDALSI